MVKFVTVMRNGPSGPMLGVARVNESVLIYLNARVQTVVVNRNINLPATSGI